MSSRNTIDTNILRIREVFAFNPLNNDFIQPEAIPVIGEAGKLKYYSSLQLLSTISVPTTSTNVLDLITSIQPGLSTLSTAITGPTFFVSTVAGLGTSGYVSTSFLQNKIDQLSYTYKYISSTTLYDCFTNLANMQIIGNQLGPMIIGSNLNGGYVSTMNPGEYKIYKSTIPLAGADINAYPFGVNINVATAQIDIGGFSNHIVNNSKMLIEVQTNANLYFQDGLQQTCTLSSFLFDLPNFRTVQSHVVDIPYYQSNAVIGTAKFFLTSNDLTPFPPSLQLRFRQSNQYNDTCVLTTMIPKINGIFITLDNTD